MVVGVAVHVGPDDGRSRRGETGVGEVDEALLVDRVVERLAELVVAQHGVAHGARLVVAVELQVVPTVVGVGDRLDTRRRLELGEVTLRDITPDAVYPAGAQVGDHGVGVLVRLEVDLVDGRLLAPVVGVPDHLDVAALDVVHDLERATADDRRLVTVGRGGGVRRDVLPDVLGQDGYRLRLHVADRHGVRAGDPHRRWVERGDRLDALQVVQVLADAVLEHILVGEGHVGGGQRRAVLELDAAPDVDRPHLAVGRYSAVLLRGKLGREVERGLVAVVHAEQVVVVQRPDLPAGGVVADEGVEVVGLFRPAEPEHHLTAGTGARRRARREGAAHAPNQAQGHYQ